MPFDPVHFILLASVPFRIIGPQCKNRRMIFSMKCCAEILFGIYLFLLSGYAGVMATFIAFLGSFVQFITPDHLMRKTFPIRFISACLLSIIGIYYLANNISDIYPFLGVLIARFFEISKSTKVIRLGYIFAMIPWLFYHYFNGFYLPLFTGMITASSLIIGFIRHETTLFKKDRNQHAL